MTHLKDVKFLIGQADIQTTPLPIYDDEVCNFLADLSNALMKSPQARLYPDVSALAFWCRKANIQKLKSEFGNTDSFIGRGMCFHIAPSNIPINFAFSYFFSLLAGNANIVRLPSKDFPQVDYLCREMSKVLENYPQIAERTAFVRYPRESNATEVFSALADARMIWGGDNTINQLKSVKTKPRCVDIAFADRYSIALIDGSKVLEADEEAMNRLCENFYNDTYLMDQNACSSPQLIYWLNDSKAARGKFWHKVFAVADKKYVLQDAVAVDKFTQLCEDAITENNIGSITFTDNLLYRAELTSIDSNVENLRGKGGYFYEYALGSLDDLYSVITARYQTITYFGIDADKLQYEIIKNHLTGVDRIVPIGKSMDIGVFWDGHDLVRELSRQIIAL